MQTKDLVNKLLAGMDLPAKKETDLIFIYEFMYAQLRTFLFIYAKRYPDRVQFLLRDAGIELIITEDMSHEEIVDMLFEAFGMPGLLDPLAETHFPREYLTFEELESLALVSLDFFTGLFEEPAS